MQTVIFVVVNVAVLTVCLSVVLTLVSLTMWSQAGRALARGALTAGVIGCLVLAFFVGTIPDIGIASVPAIIFAMVINVPSHFIFPGGIEALPTWYLYTNIVIFAVCVARWVSAYNKW
jgi:hypothetical protein